MGKIARFLGHIGNLQVLYFLVSTGFGLVAGHLWLIEGYSTPIVVLAALVSFACSFLIFTLAHHWIDRWLRAKRQPAHHKEILREIADKLGRLRDLADSPGSWTRMNPQSWQVEHSQKYEAVRREATSLVNQISYDEPTHATCRDYMHICGMVVFDHLHRETDEARSNARLLDRIGRALFRYLHDGRSVDRRKVDLPDWCQTGARAMLEEATKQPLPVLEPNPRVLAEARAIAQELDGRLAYVSLVLRNGDQEAIENWLGKVELQRVPFCDLGRDHPATLTENEGAQVRSAVRALAELDRAIDLLIANPDRYEASHAAGIYKQRATKARIMLQDLFKTMGSEG